MFDLEKIVLVLERRSYKLESGCWEWNGARTSAGYGEINRAGKVRYTHRLSWEIHEGPIPDGLDVLHRCDNPSCWNPKHLFLGNDQDNVNDKIAKGRLRHGHLYGDEHPARKNPVYIKSGEEHYQARLTWDIVRAIRAAYAMGESQADIARRFNANRGTVYKIVNNQQWKE